MRKVRKTYKNKRKTSQSLKLKPVNLSELGGKLHKETELKLTPRNLGGSGIIADPTHTTNNAPEEIKKDKICDPYTNTTRVEERLTEEYRNYGKLVIAFDYDYTLNNFRDEDWMYPRVERILRLWSKYATLICFTASTESRHPSIEKDLQSRGINIDGINTDAIQINQSMGRKIYYNILLDDRAGLRESVEILEGVYQKEHKRRHLMESYQNVKEGETLTTEAVHEWVRGISQREIVEEIERNKVLTELSNEISNQKGAILGRHLEGYGEIKYIQVQDPKVIHEEYRTQVALTVIIGGYLKIVISKTLNKKIQRY